MQRDAHFYATLALCKAAEYSDEKALLIAWANYMTDCWSGTQVKYPWSMFYKNPGPYFHFLAEERGGVVVANSNRSQALVRNAETCIEVGMALHTYQDTSSHAGFVGRFDRRNEMGLLRRWLPKYGHTQMLELPDRMEIVWTDPRTHWLRDNQAIFKSCLIKCFKFLTPLSITTVMDPIFDVCLIGNYGKRKKKWAALAEMPDIRFSKIKAGMWAKHKQEFIAAAKRQKRILLKGSK